MTDERERNRQREGRRNTPPSLELSHGPIVKAGDNTFSTTVCVSISGWWEGGLPRGVKLYVDDEEENEIGVQDRRVSFPLVGLEAESHHVVAATVREHWVEKLITVPPLPEPKRPEEEALERERTELERARVADELADLKTPKRVARKVYVTFVGDWGKQRLLVSVSDEAGNFIPGASVVIVDGEEVHDRKTNGNGSLVYQMDFAEQDRYVEVRAGNEHDLIWRARLNGPLTTRS